jgi:hypothetical protein
MWAALAARSTLGLWSGRLLAPLTAAVSKTRQARMFHPDGVVYRAQVTAVASPPELRALGESLAGQALARFSSAWWRGKDWPDVLGLALRFREGPLSDTAPRPTDQDLLLATVRFPWTTPFAPLATRFGSFLWNHYHAVSPFELPGVGRVKLRLRSPRIANHGAEARAEHLARCVVNRQAQWVLELRRLAAPFALRRWEAVAVIRLEEAIDIDQESLRFSPFLNGRGFEPIGFVHHLRVAAYAASQRARPAIAAGAR